MHITIEALEQYLAHRYGGWGKEESMFMKLVEEIGEVAEVLNKKAGRKTNDEADINQQLGIELADMLHYIVAIAALNNLDLEKIILEKDKKASVKYNHDINLEQFLQNS
jgi:NTP pyrophosphatase (non-canonical NTP hydrolase)